MKRKMLFLSVNPSQGRTTGQQELVHLGLQVTQGSQSKQLITKGGYNTTR